MGLAGSFSTNIRMTPDLIATLIGLAGGGVGAWVHLTNKIAQMNERIKRLEKSEDNINEALKSLLDMVQEIKVLLAGKGIQ